MTWADTAIVAGIITFIVLLVWSKVMGQTMLDTIIEIKEMIKSIRT